MKKRFLAGFAVLILCAIMSFGSCKTAPPPIPEEAVEEEVVLPQAPKFNLQDIRVEKIDSTKVELFISVEIENPNDYELPQPRLNFDYQIYERSIIRRRLGNEGALPAFSSTPVVFGILIYYADLYQIFPELIKSRETPSLLKLTCDPGVPVINDEIVKLNVPFTLPIQW